MPRHRPPPPAPPPLNFAQAAAQRQREVRAEGAAAHAAGLDMINGNPYRDLPGDDRWDWQRGWLDAGIAAREAPS